MKLATGDFISKAFYFLAFIYLARILGVSSFGVLEFANAIMIYVLLLGEAGLDRWGVRAAAQTADVFRLAGQLVPFRFLLAGFVYIALLACLPLLPDFPGLTALLTVFGLTVFAQAGNLKWIYMGRQEMSRVGLGLALSQLAFAFAVFVFVKSDAELVWVAAFRVASEILLATYFLYRYAKQFGLSRITLQLREGLSQLRPALTMGVAQFLSLINFNFDTLLLGLLLSERDVGWYGAAYKPVTVMLAVPITYFVGYFSVLSRAHAEDKEEFTRIVHRSLRLTCLLAIPVGIGVSLLAAPLVLLLFGIEYAPAVPVLQMLAWSAVLVVLRGNYRHALHAAGKQDADLRFSYVATGMNIVLNCLWIPQYGMIGAAWATVISEVAWLLLSWFGYRRHVSHMAILPFLWRPLLAGALLASGLHWLPIEIWFLRAFVATVIYFAALWALADPELRNWLRMLRGN